MFKPRGTSGYYRFSLNDIKRHPNRQTAYNLWILFFTKHIIERYIALTLWVLALALHLTCLIQTELGMFHLTALLLPRILIKVLINHGRVEMLSAIRDRLRQKLKKLVDQPTVPI